MMKKYKYYIFDFDGTLVDSIESLYDVFILSFKAVGVDNVSQDDCQRYARMPLVEAYKEKNAPMDKVDIFAKRIMELLDDPKTISHTKLYDDTVPVLEYFKQNNIKAAIATNNRICHVLDVMDFFHLDHDLFSFYIGNDEVKNNKPAPDAILKAMEKANFLGSPSDVVYVGDAINDVLAAKAAGIDGILLDRENVYQNTEYLTIKTLKELIL